MRDRLARLHGEFKLGGRRRDPASEELFCCWTAKCVVQFDGIEARGVIAEKSCRRKLRRIEVGLPGRISPSRRARVYCPHVVFSRRRPSRATSRRWSAQVYNTSSQDFAIVSG